MVYPKEARKEKTLTPYIKPPNRTVANKNTHKNTPKTAPKPKNQQEKQDTHPKPRTGGGGNTEIYGE